jgi:hypothetical protein
MRRVIYRDHEITLQTHWDGRFSLNVARQWIDEGKRQDIFKQ